MIFFDKNQQLKKQLNKVQYVKSLFVAVFVISGLVNCKSEQKQPETAEKQPVIANINSSGTQTSSILPTEIPPSYKTNCAECHGDKGQGVKAAPELAALTTREEDRRSDEDLLGILNNPKSFGLSSKMKSYKDKLTEDEKQEIIRWIKSLK
jgi:mono/diheme cytochrome c family protein